MSAEGGSAAPAEQITEEAVSAALGDRPARAYPAMLSTEADALAWARAGAPSGAVVVAGYQVSPRGRAGLEWTLREGVDLGFSMVLRPELPVEREGWLYTVATVALSDALEGAEIHWPDEVRRDDRRVGAVGVQTEPGETAVTWAVLTVAVHDAAPGLLGALADVAEAVERRLEAPAAQVLDRHRSRLATLGRQVRARLVPLGPSGTEVAGRAVDCRDDGSLVLLDERQRRVAVRPQHLGVLDEVATGG